MIIWLQTGLYSVPNMRGKMFSMKSVCLLFLCFVYVNCQSSQYTYDCSRLDDCWNGGTCTEFGACFCRAGFEGYNCEKDTSLAACGDPAKCLNGGQCVDDNGADTCLCSYGYSGATCENENVNLICSGTSMTIDLRFPDTFSGVVKIEPVTNDTANSAIPSECYFRETAGQYTLEVQLAGTPDPAKCQKEYITTLVDAETSATSYTSKIRIQYMRDLVTYVDQIYTLSCTVRASGVISIYKDITNLDVDTDLLPAFGKNETYDPIVFEILDISNALFDGAVELYVGTPFQISVRLEDDRVYKGVRFESCTANNTHLDNMLTYELFKNGCPTNQGKRTTKGQADHPTDPRLGKVILVVAFKFVNSKSIGLKCDITVCTEAEDAACKAPTDVECDNIRKNDTIPTEDPEHPVDSTTEVPETTAEITTTFENSTDAEATPTENPADTTELSAENPTTVEHSTDAEVPPTENQTTAENPTDTLLPTVENPTDVTEHQTENPTTAENPTEPSLKRRRRAAGDDKNRTVSTVITVLGPQDYTSDIKKATPVDSTVDDCLARSEILAVLVVLASTVCILLIACFALASVVVRKRSKKNMFEPATCINLDRFQIPRAHVNEAFREI